MQDKELEAIRALAEAATPGPWKAIAWTCNALTTVRAGGVGVTIADTTGHGRNSAVCEIDAAYIAAANPAAILSLISRIEQQAARIAELEGVAHLWKRDSTEASGAALIGKCQICVCGQPDTAGVTHRTDGPCYVTESAPVVREGKMTADQINEVARRHYGTGATEQELEFARAVEREVLATGKGDAEPKMTVRDGTWWPEGYSRDPNGVIVAPAGKHVDFKFGFDIGYAEGLVAHKDSVAAIEKRVLERLATGKGDSYRQFVEELATKAGWKREDGEGAFECVQRISYEQGFADKTRKPEYAWEGELPELPWPAMPHGSYDYYSKGQMEDYARLAIARATTAALDSMDTPQLRAAAAIFWSEDKGTFDSPHWHNFIGQVACHTEAYARKAIGAAVAGERDKALEECLAICFEIINDTETAAASEGPRILTRIRSLRSNPDAEQQSSVERDAARYRWLRNPDIDVGLVLDKKVGFAEPMEGVPGSGGYNLYEYRAGDELDAAIDAAMLANPASVQREKGEQQ